MQIREKQKKLLELIVVVHHIDISGAPIFYTSGAPLELGVAHQ